MSTQATPASYRPAQIILHWVVVVGVLFQFGANEQIVRVNEAQRAGEVPAAGDVTLALMHASVGSVVLLAVLARFFLRYKYGAPSHAPGTPPLQATIATTVHWALYGILVLIILSGMLTWNGVANLGDAHFFLGTALFFLIIAHAGAALYNQFVRKDGTMRRMMLSSAK
jgi:cytochrome b561